jgi:hypothetical protein
MTLILDRHVDDFNHQGVSRLSARDVDRSRERVQLSERHRFDEIVLRVHLAEEREVVRGLNDQGLPDRHLCQWFEVMLPLEMEVLLVSGHPFGLLGRCCHDCSFCWHGDRLPD